MAACTERGAGCALAACLPCFCGGLTFVSERSDSWSAYTDTIKKGCTPYVASADVRSLGVRIGISMLIVVINNVLLVLLQGLVAFEKHWTKSDKERAYAVAAFVSQLLNSVLVLLLVNAQVWLQEFDRV